MRYILPLCKMAIRVKVQKRNHHPVIQALADQNISVMVKKIYISCKRTSWELPYESCLFLLKTCIMGKRSGQNGLNFDLGTMEKILDEAIRETNFLHML